MKRPIVWIFLFYLFGILGGRYSLSISYAVLLFVLLVFIMTFIYLKFSWNGILLFPLIFLFGFIRINQSIKPKNIFLNQFINNHKNYNNVKIIGTAKNVIYDKQDKVNCIIDSKNITYGHNTYEKPLKIKAYLNGNLKIQNGDLIQVEGEILNFEPSRNPGAWNETLYMKTRKIDYKLYGDLMRTIPSSSSLIKKIYQLRDKFSEIYDRLLPYKQASIIKAMIIGEKSGLDQEQKLIYQQAGISHILAISGLHISIIAMFLAGLFKIMKIPKLLSSLCVILFLWIYCVLTGFGISTVRAVIMITIVLLSKVLLRSYDVYTSLSLAAFLILLKQPLFLWDAGFQLSLTALLGLLIIAPIFNKIFCLPQKIRIAIGASMGAGLATLPIVGYHFYYISMIGFLLNLIIVPLATIVVGFGFFAGVVGLFWIQGARFIMGIVYYILNFYEYISKTFIQLPCTNIITGIPSVIQIILYYISLLIPILYINLKRKFNIDKKILLYSITICILLWGIVLMKNDLFEIVFLDVGQGDAIAIHTDSHKNIIIDGGEKDCNKVVLPYFRYKGIKSLDAMILSHPDKDHITGLIGILDNMDVKNIYVTVKDLEKDEDYQDFIIKANQLDIPCHLLKQGDKISFDDVVFYCLYPIDNKGEFSESWNKKSMTLKMVYGKHSFLFTGDIEKEEETNIIYKNNTLEVDFLKVPHHGSKTSSSQEFIDWCNPDYAVISCGKNNRYGHPHKEVLERYINSHVNVINTANSGAITVFTDGERYKIKTILKNRGSEYDNIERRIEKKYFSFGILILWGGTVFIKFLFGTNTKKADSC